MQSLLKAQIAVGVIGISSMFGLVAYSNSMRSEAKDSSECKAALQTLETTYPKLAEALQNQPQKIDSVTIVMKPKPSGYSCVFFKRNG